MNSLSFVEKNRSLFYRYLPAFLVLFLFFVITIPGNKSEADDGLAYAYLVRTQDWDKLFLSRYLLFLPFFKAVHYVLGSIGLSADVYLTMAYLSCIFSALTILVCYRILTRVLKVSREAAIWGCLFLAFSYGFWRYSVEAEVYSLANLFCVLILYLVFKPRGTRSATVPVIIAGVLAGLAALIYKPNAIPVFFCYPLYFLFTKRWKGLFLYSASAIVVTIGVYYIVFINLGRDITFMGFLVEGSSRSYGSPLLTCFILLSNIITTNFIFGIEPIKQFVSQKFPANIITEEVFAARRNSFFNHAAVASFVALAGIMFLLLVKGWRLFSRKSITAVHYVILGWILFYSITLLYLDPNSPEPWTMLIVPLSLLITSLWIYPFFRQMKKTLPYLFIAVLLIHNYMGGYKLIANKKSDYSAHVTGWLLKNSQRGDLILSLGSRYTLTYIQYNTPANLCSPEQSFDRCLKEAEATIASGARVFILDDVINADQVVKFRHPETFEKTKQFVSKYRDYLIPVNAGDPLNGVIYELRYKGTLQTGE
jgi:hypothetical protein